MPRTTKRKKTTAAKGRTVRDADTVIRSYEESGDAPGGDLRDKYSATADRTVSDRTPLKRKIEEVGPDAVRVHGGDIDAGLDTDQAGDETVGGSSPTPDQDVVDELGSAAGLTYEDAEPLDPGKVERRDDHRWEDDPASSEDYRERQKG